MGAASAKIRPECRLPQDKAAASLSTERVRCNKYAAERVGAMLTTRVAGEDFELDAAGVERAVAGVDPEPIREHLVHDVAEAIIMRQLHIGATWA